MSFSDEEIIAFLLGDADDGLANRIRSSLHSDQDLAERICHFRSLLNHLDSVSEVFMPPASLVDDTMARIEVENLNPSSAQSSDGHPTASEFDQPVASCLTVASETTSQGRHWADTTALTISLTILCCLTIPAIVRARFESRRAQCADNLRQTGLCLFEYATRRPDHRYPFVPSAGPEAFSGVFVVRLNDEGLLPNGRMMPCASLNGIDRPSCISYAALPTAIQLCTASDSQLAGWKCSLGGDYAYNLGVFEDQRLVAPKNVGSSHFAILADAPLFVDDSDQVVAHDGKGMNILYDDGQVRFVNSQWIKSGESTIDNPFRNIFGAREAGIGYLDASLAPSQFPPVANLLTH